LITFERSGLTDSFYITCVKFDELKEEEVIKLNLDIWMIGSDDSYKPGDSPS